VYPIEYEAGADRTRWRQFLESLFRDDEDKEQKIEFLGEFLGASLFGIATKYQRGVIAKGNGSNGKSTLMGAVLGAFPDKSVASIQPQTMAQRFGLTGLKGRLLNYVDELKNSYLKETEECKSAIVGKELRGEDKNKDAAPFNPIAGHFFGANKLPATSDQSHGFWRRWGVVTFNRKFEGDEIVRDLDKRLLVQDRAAIFAWLVDGVVRLLARGDYELPSSHFEALKEWREDGDTFVEWLESGRGSAVDTPCSQMRELYLDYRGFTEDGNQKPLSETKFSQKMKDSGLERARDKSKLVPYRLDSTRALVGNARRAAEAADATRRASMPSTVKALADKRAS
jgi:putative DNA primase/helicase